MAKPKIPYGFTRDPKTGRLRKKRTAGRKRQTGKGTTRRKKTQQGRGAMVLAAKAAAKAYGPTIAKETAKILGPIVLTAVGDAIAKKINPKKGSGLRLMGQRNK